MDRKKFILSIISFFVILLSIYIYYTDNKNNSTIHYQIENNKKQYIINIQYPKTPYRIINQAIDNKIRQEINQIKINQKEYLLQPPNFTYNLVIKYQTYYYKQYISYFFTIFIDSGGAHPNTYFWTLSYNSKQDKIIDINYLLTNNPNLLNNLSKLSRELLIKQNKNLNYTKDMLIAGTNPTKNNFKNFVLTNKGMKIFFENYQIAPYSMGSFDIIIPYSLLQIDL